MCDVRISISREVRRYIIAYNMRYLHKIYDIIIILWSIAGRYTMQWSNCKDIKLHNGRLSHIIDFEDNKNKNQIFG